MGGCCSAWWNKRGFLATSSGAAWFYGVASEHDTLSAWDMENASNIVLVSACTNNRVWRALTCCCGQIGTPQTEHSPSALNVTGCDTVEIFGVLSTAMHPDYYTKQHRGLPALITMSDNRRTRLVAPLPAPLTERRARPRSAPSRRRRRRTGRRARRRR